ncbi:MAG: RIP metalloprotease [Thermoleophilia bacterium]|nr:RIP metalloprotease [Thermoleophilia bacterium]
MLGGNIVQFVLILMVLILVHEAGHLLVAKWCGMRVERFSIFFGRPVLKFTRGETEYGVGWLPLGGYVKITGMTRDEDLPADVVPRTYYAAATWKKVATIAAGPLVNLLVAVLCFTLYFWIGVPTFQASAEIDKVTGGSPAAALGIVPGDRILAVNGVTTDGAGGIEGARTELMESPGASVRVTFQHAGTERTRSVVLRAEEGADGVPVGRLGVQFRVTAGPRESAGAVGGVTTAGRYVWFLIEENAKGIGQLFTSSEARDQVGSVVAIGAVYNEVASGGLMEILRFVGLISLVLAIFNLLPIFPLDGGHILFALIERVKGSPISTRVYERSAMLGWAVILIVFVFALQNDIGKLADGGFTLK